MDCARFMNLMLLFCVGHVVLGGGDGGGVKEGHKVMTICGQERRKDRNVAVS